MHQNARGNIYKDRKRHFENAEVVTKIAKYRLMRKLTSDACKMKIPATRIAIT